LICDSRSTGHRQCEGQLFGEFARQSPGVLLALVGAAAGQFPFAAGVLKQHDPPVEQQHAFDRDRMAQATGLVI